MRYAGMVEGFYGPPYSHAERLGMIDFLASVGLDTYLYAPKDDGFLRSEWARPYDEVGAAQVRELAARSAERDVRFVFAISPGLSMVYSRDSDVAALIGKLEQVVRQGVTDLALLLDDIPAALRTVDAERFDSLVRAQAHVINEVVAADLSERLLVCPTQYWGRGDEEYISDLASHLADQVDLLWTGRRIRSPYLDTRDAEYFTEHTGKRPIYWDNYPVNDLLAAPMLHLGPYIGREATLPMACDGLLLNVMQYPESSKIALATMAEYVAAPHAYDPEAAWDRALRRIGGDADFKHVRLFADNVRSSHINEFDSPRLSALLEGLHLGPRGDAVAALSHEAERMAAAAAALLGDGVSNTSLSAEIRPWVTQFALAAQLTDAIASYYLGDSTHRINDLAAQWRRSPVRVCGDVLDMAITEITS